MSFLNQLNSAQREAAKNVNGPVMVVAGAGSGKTRVLTFRIAYLLSLGVRPDSVLALTFTNKAAGEMKERITGLVGEGSRQLWMGTFHSIFARVLRFEAERIGYERNFTIYDSDDSLSLIRGIMNSLGIPGQQFSPSAIRSRISRAKNAMQSPSVMRDGPADPMTEKTAAVFEEYERRLKKSNAMDFDDLLLKPLELFNRHADVLERYQYRFKYILVDEYQDTNRVQYLLIKELARLNRNVCVVGDDAQSIYGFRGADIKNILDFEKDYPDCAIHRLEQNYRSTKTILAAAGSVIKRNSNQIPKTLWTENDEGEQVTVHTCSDDREEGYRIVSTVQDEIRKKKLGLKDFAVLYRTNAQSRSIEDALRRTGIPYVIVGGVAFYKRKEIKDVLAYLGVIANPRDEESILRIINVPARGIGDTSVKKLREAAGARGLYEAMAMPEVMGELPERTQRAVRNFRNILAKFIALKDQTSVGELARALVDDIGIMKAYEEENTPESLNRIENIRELVSALSEFSVRDGGGSLEDFLQEVSLVSDVDQAEFGRNAVTLMTLHAAKGLEFPVVFVSGLEEGLFPLGGATNDRQDLEEERRLMYVGMTRAREKLHLSWAITRYRYGELSYSTRSRFLDEIDRTLIREESSSARPDSPYRRDEGRPIPQRAPSAPPRRKPETGHSFASDPMPDYENESQVASNVRVGTRVMHESFGRGKIMSIDGSGENARAVVDFESVGRKHLMLKFANLRPV
jgi:DNA helicase II / ATP-dependent DNA helicase PcrA